MNPIIQFNPIKFRDQLNDFLRAMIRSESILLLHTSKNLNVPATAVVTAIIIIERRESLKIRCVFEILPHKHHIHAAQHKDTPQQIPIPIRLAVEVASNNHPLRHHIDRRHYHMRYFQLIRHNLI